MARKTGAVGLGDMAPLNLLGHPVRRRLYDVVSAASGAIGRDEAAAAVGVSRSLAAYHLDRLVEQGLLEAGFARAEGRSGPGAGRPAKRYGRAQREFALRVPPRDYRLLAELLVAAAAEDDSGVIREALERVAYNSGRSLGEDANLETGEDRITLECLLRRRGYEPFADESKTIRLRNCPFHAVARRDPEFVCGLNLRLVEGLIDGLDIHAHAVLEPEARQCCVAITIGGDQ
jgi:predicted ArsR family transcriptional regulator